MVVGCLIEFDNNPYCTYFAGQVVTGKVTLTADKPKQVKGVALKIYGYARTYWSESTTHRVTGSNGKSESRTSTTHFSGREDYIASITYLLGSESDQSLVIAPGIHTYNFSCHIPVVCPSSFEGRYGHIRYIIRVSLIRPWKFDQTFTKGFTVLKIMDLNYESPLLKMPASAEVQKTFCCGPCRSEPLTISVSVGQGGFVPGQNIPISLTVKNDSNIAVEETEISLFMVVCFYSQMPRRSYRTSRDIVTKFKGEGVLRHCKKLFNYELPVPATPPSCFNLCRIIQISYEVTVEAKVKGMHSNQVIGIPIVIGNVPLMGVIQQQPISNAGMQRGLLDTAAMEDSTSNENAGADMEHKATVAASTETEIVVPWSANANIPPPSYEVATHVPHGRINEDEMHDFGESDYAPLYPVFKISTPTAPVDDISETDGSKTTNGTWL